MKINLHNRWMQANTSILHYMGFLVHLPNINLIFLAVVLKYLTILQAASSEIEIQ